MTKRQPRTLEEAYALHTVPGHEDECWLWQGYIGQNGYGYAHIDYKDWLAHRLSFAVNKGPIPDGLLVLHKCDNPPCVNPKHLFLGTHQDNMTDKVRKGRQPRGEQNSNVKLNDQLVAQIRQELAERTQTNTAIAMRYGVGRKAIDAIESGRNWAHIPGPAPTRMGEKNLPTGSENHNAKLTEGDVMEILRLLAKGDCTQRAIAARYQVSETVISGIKLGRRWCAAQAARIALARAYGNTEAAQPGSLSAEQQQPEHGQKEGE